MINRFSAISIKISIEFLYLILSANSYWLTVFTYASDFDIEILYLKYNFNKSGLSTYVKGLYVDFDTYVCEDSTLILKVCDKIDDFKIAGACYIAIAVVSNLFALYCIVSLIAKRCRCANKGWHQMRLFHYLYPVVNSISVVLYSTISGLFTIKATYLTSCAF